MTKEECNKKVAPGEHAFFSYDHPVWDHSWKKRHGRRVVFKIPHRGPTILDEFSSGPELTL